MPEEKAPTTFTNITQLIKALVWPILILFIFIWFQGPLSEVVDLLPGMVRHATKVSAGGVTLEIEQKAQESGNEALAAALKGLSPEARKLLLQVGDSYWHEWGARTEHGQYFHSRTKALAELTKRGLVEYSPEKRETFDKWVNRLGRVTKDDSPEADSLLLIPKRPLNADEETRLLAEKFYLSPLGKKAYSVILDVVVNS